MALDSYAFLSPVPVSRVSAGNPFCKLALSKTRRRFHCYDRATTMAASLPDDAALDMLSFALSGPGLTAVTAFCIGGAAVIFSFAEVGPRRGPALQGVSFLLRITVPSQANVELPNGTVRRLPIGETVLRLHSHEACTAVARTMECPGVSYTIYRADPTGMHTLSMYPKPINAEGGAWAQGVVQRADENLLEARWEEYQRLRETGDIDEEWATMMNRLSPIQISDGSDCKLCGGSRTVRCHRCGGNAKRGGAFVCDCDNGRRACEWCRPSAG